MMRYHVNRLGRFSSPDRLAGSIADPQSLHRYAYVFNDPVNFIDPLGLDGGPCFVNGEFGFCDTVGARGGGDSPRMSFGTVGGGFGGGSLDPPPLTYAPSGGGRADLSNIIGNIPDHQHHQVTRNARPLCRRQTRVSTPWNELRKTPRL